MQDREAEKNDEAAIDPFAGHGLAAMTLFEHLLTAMAMGGQSKEALSIIAGSLKDLNAPALAPSGQVKAAIARLTELQQTVIVVGSKTPRSAN